METINITIEKRNEAGEVRTITAQIVDGNVTVLKHSGDDAPIELLGDVRYDWSAGNDVPHVYWVGIAPKPKPEPAPQP